jgi:hypothetical protein
MGSQEQGHVHTGTGGEPDAKDTMPPGHSQHKVNTDWPSFSTLQITAYVSRGFDTQHASQMKNFELVTRGQPFCLTDHSR